MNRSILLVGIGLLLSGFVLIAFPIAFTGEEQFDLEQEAGLFFLAPAMAVVLIGAISENPMSTTVGGTFGNPDARSAGPSTTRASPPTSGGLGFSPREPVRCRYCSSIITYDLAQCPRCARPRECRNCGRPLAILHDEAACPPCARSEALCNCPHLPPRPATGTPRGRRV